MMVMVIDALQLRYRIRWIYTGWPKKVRHYQM